MHMSLKSQLLQTPGGTNLSASECISPPPRSVSSEWLLPCSVEQQEPVKVLKYETKDKAWAAANRKWRRDRMLRNPFKIRLHSRKADMTLTKTRAE